MRAPKFSDLVGSRPDAMSPAGGPVAQGHRTHGQVELSRDRLPARSW
jgi:hypothetical protein